METKIQECIEILPVSLLEQNRSLVTELKQLASGLGLELGWHYLLDLTWIIRRLNDLPGRRFMDAGAGVGVLQWYLAEHGADVLSVDRGERSSLALRFRSRYQVKGLRDGVQQDLKPGLQVFKTALLSGGVNARLAALYYGAMTAFWPKRAAGKVTFYNQDLKALVDIPSASLDAIAAVSALEHNPPDELPQTITELMRVLKPGGILLATLGAARDRDWFHEPSHGWCYTEATLRRLFALSGEAPSNYGFYDEYFAQLYECAELRDHLARFYFRSGENGMPWGKWDPQYPVVAICKIKPQLNTLSWR